MCLCLFCFLVFEVFACVLSLFVFDCRMPVFVSFCPSDVKYLLPHFISVFPIWGCLGGVLAYLLVLDNSIKVLSANCQSLQNQQKRVDVLHYFKEMNANIICLQDTH